MWPRAENRSDDEIEDLRADLTSQLPTNLTRLTGPGGNFWN